MAAPYYWLSKQGWFTSSYRKCDVVLQNMEQLLEVGETEWTRMHDFLTGGYHDELLVAELPERIWRLLGYVRRFGTVKELTQWQAEIETMKRKEDSKMAASKKKAVAKKAVSKKKVSKKTASKKAPAKKKTATAKKVANGKGYKGHREGSTKGKMHKWFDEHKPERQAFIAHCEKQGLATSTASNWYQRFNAA